MRIRAGYVFASARICILNRNDVAWNGSPPYTCGRANPATFLRFVLLNRNEACVDRLQHPFGHVADSRVAPQARANSFNRASTEGRIQPDLSIGSPRWPGREYAGAVRGQVFPERDRHHVRALADDGRLRSVRLSLCLRAALIII